MSHQLNMLFVYRTSDVQKNLLEKSGFLQALSIQNDISWLVGAGSKYSVHQRFEEILTPANESRLVNENLVCLCFFASQDVHEEESSDFGFLPSIWKTVRFFDGEAIAGQHTYPTFEATSK